MAHDPTYGSLFVTHLTKLGRHVPYLYRDLQQVKGMNQTELADWIKGECPGVFRRKGAGPGPLTPTPASSRRGRAS